MEVNAGNEINSIFTPIYYNEKRLLRETTNHFSSMSSFLAKFTVELIAAVLNIVLLSFVYSKLQKRTHQQVEKDESNYYSLRMRKLYLVSAIVFLAGAVASFGMFVNIKNSGEIVLGSVFILIFGGLGLHSLAWYRNHRLIFNDQFVEIHSWTGKATLISWREIKGWKYNLNNQSFRLTLASGNKASVSEWFIGMETFKTILKRKTNIELIGNR